MSNSEQSSASSSFFSFEESDSGSESETLLERRGRKSNPKSDTKDGLKRASPKDSSEQMDKKKRKMSASSLDGGSLEAAQCFVEPTPAQKLCSLVQTRVKLTSSLLRRNVVISADCSPSNKNILDCVSDAVKEICDPAGNKILSEDIAAALAENLIKIIEETQFNADANQGQNPFEILLEKLVAVLPPAHNA